MSKLHEIRTRPKVLIAGGGVAALETLLALRRLVRGTVTIELLSPEPEFTYRPLAVAEPFGIGEVRAFDVARIAAEHDAQWRQGVLSSVDPRASAVRTAAGERLTYDHLVVAHGAQPSPSIDGALTFTGALERGALRAVLADAEARRVLRIVFALPPGVVWALPLYELALFTASWGRKRKLRGLDLSLVTPESRPLESFGEEVSDAVGALLDDARIAVVTERTVTRFDGHRALIARRSPLPADAVIALPRLHGQYVPGLAHDADGFIPTDRHGRVRAARRIYAAGDCTSFPIKQGGLAAQQADAVAETIAAGLGAIDEPQAFSPVLRGLLLTGAEPRYLRTTDGSSEITFRPLWWPPGKIAGRYLAPYLSGSVDALLDEPQLVDRSAPDEPESAAEIATDERDAVDLLLELADANARRGSLIFALKCLAAAEDVGGPLPHERQEDRRKWETAAYVARAGARAR